MANRIKGITIEIDGNTTPLNKALADVNKTITKTQSELRDVNKLLDFDPSNVQLLEQKQGLLLTSINATEQKLKEEKEALEQLKKAGNTEETQAQQRALEREIVATEQSLTKYEDELIQTSQKLQGVDKASEKAEDGLEDTGKAAKESGENAKKGEKGWSTFKEMLAHLAADAVKATAKALVSLGKASVKAVGEAAKAGDEIDKMSQKLGMSRKGYQEWDFVLSQAGVDINSIQTGMKTMTNQIGQAKNGVAASVETFNALGISMEELQGMSREDAFKAIVTSLQGMEDSTERAALANKLFGKSGQNLTPLFNQSAEATDELIKKANELGMVMSDDAVDAGVEFQDQLAGLQHTFEATKNGIISNLLPGVTEAMSGFQMLMTGAEGGAEAIQKGVNDVLAQLGPMFEQFTSILAPILSTIVSMLPAIFNGISNAILTLFPKILSTVLKILPGLVSSIATVAVKLASTILKMLPTIVTAIVQIVTMLLPQIGALLPQLINAIIKVVPLLVDALIKSIPSLLTAAIQFLMAIVQALPTIISRLSAAIPKIIKTLVSFLTKPSNIAMILKAAITLLGAVLKAVPQIVSSLASLIPSIINAIGKGLKGGISDIKEAAGELFGKIKDKASEMASNALTWGKDLIDNFISGIRAKFSNLKQAVKDLAQLVKDIIGFSEPKEGPLSKFHTFAPDMIDLWIKTLNQSLPKLESAVSGMAATIANTTSGATTNNQSVTVNQYNSYSAPHSQYELWLAERSLKRTINNTVRGAV